MGILVVIPGPHFSFIYIIATKNTLKIKLLAVLKRLKADKWLKYSTCKAIFHIDSTYIPVVKL